MKQKKQFIKNKNILDKFNLLFQQKFRSIKFNNDNRKNMKRGQKQQQEKKILKNNRNYLHFQMPVRPIIKQSRITQQSFKSVQLKGRKSLNNIKAIQSNTRDIYATNHEHILTPAPDQYYHSSKISPTHGFIAKVNPKLFMKSGHEKIKSTLVGPGFYPSQNQEIALSNHPRSSVSIFSPTKIARTIPSHNDESNIHYCLQNLDKIRKVATMFPGPGKYIPEGLEYKTSNFRSTFSHSISSTKRSSLINNQKIPGPGAYNYTQQYDKKSIQKYHKPKIEYKFVWGHPS